MRMKKLDEKLGPEYLEVAAPSIAKQLAKAAARLAMLDGPATSRYAVESNLAVAQCFVGSLRD
jgi:hypothetical protein